MKTSAKTNAASKNLLHLARKIQELRFATAPRAWRENGNQTWIYRISATLCQFYAMLLLCGGAAMAENVSVPGLLENKGIEAYQTQAEQGDAYAQYILGFCYFNGQGVPQDFTEAAKWWRKSADQGDANAQAQLGFCYENGKGLPKNFDEAAKWYKKSAQQGNAAGQNSLGLCYDTGNGVQKDSVESIKWYRKSADQGFANGQFNLGVCYFQGQHVPQDSAEAVKWYQKAADQGFASAQLNLGIAYYNGDGLPQNFAEAANWYRKAAEQGDDNAQYSLGVCYDTGKGVPQDDDEAVKWYRKAAEQGFPSAQYNLGVCYANGRGVPKNIVDAAKYLREAAEQGHDLAQSGLATFYREGQGVAKDEVEAYKWYLRAAAQGNEQAKENATALEGRLMQEQIAEGQKLARNVNLLKTPSANASDPGDQVAEPTPRAFGTGFFITEDGFLITNNHVVAGANLVRLATNAGIIAAKVVKVDAANDLALLKAEGKFGTLPVATSRTVKLGGSVATVGFPNIGLQGFSPKLAKGEIASLSGAEDDARYFQVSLPVQPGNSGGALVDSLGNVVGVVSAKLSASEALAASGSLPENVNYAVKSSFLLSFLESVPNVADRLREPNTKEEKFETVVKSAEKAAVLVLVY